MAVVAGRVPALPRGGVGWGWGPGSMPPGRSAPRPCLHNRLSTLDKLETSLFPLGNGLAGLYIWSVVHSQH